MSDISVSVLSLSDIGCKKRRIKQEKEREWKLVTQGDVCRLVRLRE